MENKTAKAYLRYVRISPRKIQIEETPLKIYYTDRQGCFRAPDEAAEVRRGQCREQLRHGPRQAGGV